MVSQCRRWRLGDEQVEGRWGLARVERQRPGKLHLRTICCLGWQKGSSNVRKGIDAQMLGSRQSVAGDPYPIPLTSRKWADGRVRLLHRAVWLLTSALQTESQQYRRGLATESTKSSILISY